VRAIFLNRYSIINEYRGASLGQLDQSCFLPGALTALRWLRLAGFQVFVVSHQPQISRGQFSRADVEELHACLRSWVELSGGHISAVRYCPHQPHEGCTCFYPNPDMLLSLGEDWNLDLPRTYLVGDTVKDMQAGTTAGCRLVMVRTGYGAQQATLPELERCRPEYLAPDLLGAVRWVLRQEKLTLPHTHADKLLSHPTLPSLLLATGT
jgi:histidinol-phosphate phosphatase family protein